MRRIAFIILISLIAIFSFGQTDQPIAMGQWRTHLAYNSVNQLIQSPNYIYAVSDGALFAIGKDDGDMQLFSKISGLSDVGIKLIKYDDVNDQLLIIYDNGNLDIMSSSGVINIPDLYNKQLGADKGINDIYIDGNKAYLSCEFGILLINLEKREIAETYIIGPDASFLDIKSTTVVDDEIFALTEKNIYKADVTHPNIVDYQYWKPITALPGVGKLQKVMNFNGYLLIFRNGKLYRQEVDKSWTTLLDAINITALNQSQGKVIAQNGTNMIYVLNEDFTDSAFSTGDSYSFLNFEYDKRNNTYWASAGDLGVVSITDYSETESHIEFKKPKGPAENNIWNMTFAGEKLFVVNGGRWADRYNRVGEVMIYEKEQWRNIDGASIAAEINYSAYDFMSVAVDPQDDNHFFVSSYGRGLFEFKDEKFYKWYHGENSMLSPIFATNPYDYIRLDGLAYDKDGNLFISNTESQAPIKVLKNDGTWVKYEFPDGNVFTLGQVLISNQNPHHKWLNSVRTSKRGLIVYDDNGTIDDFSDDKKIMLSSFADNDNPGSTISPAEYHCMAQDRSGALWVGTELGPLVFYNPNRVFNPEYTCSRIKIPRNDGSGQADYLLKDETVKAIVIDGANRKWIGTENSGLYLMSENGQETIHHFTSTNSPLLSDHILSLAINPISGELFIGTDNGLISFQSDASQASSVFTDVYAYPNPVRENYNGVITITGLVENTQVKITDLNGNLIYQTVSNGKIATWDGKNAHGKRVNTGIYMVICANEDGTQNAITKIMVIN